MKSRGSISTDSKDSFDSSLERTTYKVVVLGKIDSAIFGFGEKMSY
jgi:hypothetical protein